MTALFPPFVVVCVLLIVAGVAKVRSPSAARAVLLEARLPVPRVAVRLLGIAEVVIGTGAAVRPLPGTAALVAVAYGAFFTFVLWIRPARCGCFGAADTGGGLTHMVLNLAACSVAVTAGLVPPPGVGSILRQGVVVAVLLGVGLAACTFAVSLMFTAFPAAWRAYGGGKA